jgi:hypothetical protein
MKFREVLPLFYADYITPCPRLFALLRIVSSALLELGVINLTQIPFL